ncbi:C-type lectin domain family 4 member K [Biomphalaria pfeifferi]|uniref:C-type lectin domain family 4 member K n=1 Tax=Biomphalaria pfeifferi TaxID=112525 RepID=A0AAD8C440_BIOPF|nr:C-type lectin domain family 4 member K [Biomphalaria pfeifferi]
MRLRRNMVELSLLQLFFMAVVCSKLNEASELSCAHNGKKYRLTEQLTIDNCQECFCGVFGIYCDQSICMVQPFSLDISIQATPNLIKENTAALHVTCGVNQIKFSARHAVITSMQILHSKSVSFPMYTELVKASPLDGKPYLDITDSQASVFLENTLGESRLNISWTKLTYKHAGLYQCTVTAINRFNKPVSYSRVAQVILYRKFGDAQRSKSYAALNYTRKQLSTREFDQKVTALFGYETNKPQSTPLLYAYYTEKQQPTPLSYDYNTKKPQSTRLFYEYSTKKPQSTRLFYEYSMKKPQSTPIELEHKITTLFENINDLTSKVNELSNRLNRMPSARIESDALEKLLADLQTKLIQLQDGMSSLANSQMNTSRTNDRMVREMDLKTNNLVLHLATILSQVKLLFLSYENLANRFKDYNQMVIPKISNGIEILTAKYEMVLKKYLETLSSKINLLDKKSYALEHGQDDQSIQIERLLTITRESYFYSSDSFNGRRYWLTKDYAFTNIVEAQRTCELYGGYLAEINSDREFCFIRDQLLVPRTSHYDAAITGASDEESEGVWINSHSGTRLTAPNWGPGEPNNFKGNEHCQSYGKQGPIWVMNDLPCYKDRLVKVGFICEISDS